MCSFDDLNLQAPRILEEKAPRRRPRPLEPSKPEYCYLCYNIGLNASEKRAVLKVYASVVSLKSYSGDSLISSASGTIIECKKANDTFLSTIITAATPFQDYNCAHNVADSIKVDVYLSDGSCCCGDLIACDFHYNIAVVVIKSDNQLQTTSLLHSDDFIPVCPGKKNSDVSTMRRNPSLIGPDSRFKLYSGVRVIAVGRGSEYPFELFAFSGEFSDQYIDSDGKGLIWADCKSIEAGTGGPVIDCHGHVIGIGFYGDETTPFLPCNILEKWWEHVSTNKGFWRPLHGMALANLHTECLCILECLTMGCSQNFEGVIVNKVIPGSPAAVAEIQPDDVIMKCCQKAVCSLLEFLEIMWDSAGKTVELLVFRPRDGSVNRRYMKVEITTEKFYWLPRYEITLGELGAAAELKEEDKLLSKSDSDFLKGSATSVTVAGSGSMSDDELLVEPGISKTAEARRGDNGILTGSPLDEARKANQNHLKSCEKAKSLAEMDDESRVNEETELLPKFVSFKSAASLLQHQEGPLLKKVKRIE